MQRQVFLVSALVLLSARAAAAEEPWQAAWQKTLSAARTEGVVLVSGPPGPFQREAVVTAWEKEFPDIKIEYTAARGTQILSKVVRERESGLYNWDIVLASTDPTVLMLDPINALAPLRDALIDPASSDDKAWFGGFDEGFVDTPRKFFYSPLGVAGMSLGYVNRDCVSAATFSKTDDLKKPELKGKVAWADPLLPGSGSRSTWRLTVDRGVDWLKDYYQNYDVTFSRDYHQLTDWLVTCRKPIVIGIPGETLLQMQKQGIGTKVDELTGEAYFGDHGLGWAGGNEDIGWYNDAPHPNAAKLFVNAYLSRAFQQHYADLNAANSRRLDTEPRDPDPNNRLDPKLNYATWGDEASILEVKALQKKIETWGVLK